MERRGRRQGRYEEIRPVTDLRERWPTRLPAAALDPETPLPPPLVQLLGITKRFPPSILANDRISLDIAEGEIHALLGENGAGKSTLMQILYGVYRKDAGEIRIAGEPCEFATPRDAIRRGIGMIHQEFMLVRAFSVAENVAMGADGAGQRYDLA